MKSQFSRKIFLFYPPTHEYARKLHFTFPTFYTAQLSAVINVIGSVLLCYRDELSNINVWFTMGFCKWTFVNVHRFDGCKGSNSCDKSSNPKGNVGNPQILKEKRIYGWEYEVQETLTRLWDTAVLILLPPTFSQFSHAVMWQISIRTVLATSSLICSTLCFAFFRERAMSIWIFSLSLPSRCPMKVGGIKGIDTFLSLSLSSLFCF